MSFEGTIVNGNIVLDEPTSLPEGTRVEILEKSAAGAPTELGVLLLRHAGKAQGLPPDAATQHDHYLYGTPKR